MYSFSSLLREAELTGSDVKRQSLLEDYLSQQTSVDACWAIYLLTDKQRTRYIKPDELKQHFLRYSNIPEWLFDASNKHVDDIAECISLIQKQDGTTNTSKTNSISLESLLSDALPNFKKLETLEEKNTQLAKWWEELSGDEIYVLNKLLSGSFRGGSLKPLVISALASVFDKPETTITYKLSAKYKPSAAFFDELKDSDINPSEPFPFQEATPWAKKNKLDFNDLHVEWKYDGIRAQLIKRNHKVFLWSKEQQLLNEQFPDVVEAGAELENGTVLDGEIVGWRDSQITMMNGLRGRLERKKPTKQLLQDSPTHYKTFDLLEHQSTPTNSMSFQERRITLEHITLPNNISLTKAITLTTKDDLETHVQKARQHNADGIIIRNESIKANSDTLNLWSYQAPPHTLNAVLTYVQGNILSFSLRNNNELTTFTKVENYLTENQDLKAWIKTNSLERFGPVTSVKAEQVFEIAFDNIFESKRHKSGLSVKNPRIVAWRQDLTLDDIDSLETAKHLLS